MSRKPSGLRLKNIDFSWKKVIEYNKRKPIYNLHIYIDLKITYNFIFGEQIVWKLTSTMKHNIAQGEV